MDSGTQVFVGEAKLQRVTGNLIRTRCNWHVLRITRTHIMWVILSTVTFLPLWSYSVSFIPFPTALIMHTWSKLSQKISKVCSVQMELCFGRGIKHQQTPCHKRHLHQYRLGGVTLRCHWNNWQRESKPGGALKDHKPIIDRKHE